MVSPCSFDTNCTLLLLLLDGEKYRSDKDLAEDKGKKLHAYDEQTVVKLIYDYPITYWNNSSKRLVKFENELLFFDIVVEKEHEAILYQWLSQICEYRLHTYFKKEAK